MPRAARWLLLVACVVAQPVRAQESEAPDPAGEMTREQWAEHVRQQRLRVEQMRRERKPFLYVPPTPEQLAERREKDALDDPQLVPGDVVVTRRGLYRYLGTPTDRDRQPEDFVLIERRGPGRN